MRQNATNVSAMTDSGPTYPPADLAIRPLPIQIVARPSNIFRIHRTALGAKFFGASGNWRFDDPNKTYGTLYAGLSPEIAFAETLLRGKGTLIAEAELALRSLCTFTAREDLRMVELHGKRMFKIDADASVTCGLPYDASQAWSSAFHQHPDAPDGIVYRGTRDNSQFALVLFHRSSQKIDNGASIPLLEDKVALGALLDRYEAGLS
jgi:hypothetical protein